jgi:hypothetical protein
LPPAAGLAVEGVGGIVEKFTTSLADIPSQHPVENAVKRTSKVHLNNKYMRTWIRFCSLLMKHLVKVVRQKT